MYGIKARVIYGLVPAVALFLAEVEPHPFRFWLAGQIFGTGERPWAIATADLNADGHVDVVVANSSGNSVSVLVNRGDGSFARSVEYATGADPRSVVIGDLDGDGHPDLAVGNFGGQSISVLTNHGNGTFAVHAIYPAGRFPLSIVMGDVDLDGDADLAVANSGDSMVSVLRNHGAGSFAPPAQYPAGTAAVALAIGDLDGDGDADLAAGSASSVSVLRNQGDGSFAAPMLYGTLFSVSSIVIGDLDQDGDNDVAAAGSTGNVGVATGRVLVLRNDGGGTFFARGSILTGSVDARSLVIGDLNADGADDLAVIGAYPPNTEDPYSRVSVLTNEGGGGFALLSYRTVRFSRSIAIGDLDGDGRQDFAVTRDESGAPGGVFALFNEGAAVFASYDEYSMPLAPQSIAIADLDLDGDNDVVAAGGGPSNGAAVLLNAGDSRLSTTGYPALRGEFVAIADLDGDGDLDFVTANYTGSSVTPFVNQGDGTFVVQAPLRVLGNPRCVALADLDGDGDADLVATTGNDFVSVRLGAGDGTFGAPVHYQTEITTLFVAFADLDGDGDNDLAVSTHQSVSVLENLGDGTFGSYTAHAVPTAHAIAIGDVDGDGAGDLVVTNFWKSTVSVLRNSGNADFGIPVAYATQEFASAVALGDLNGDGRLDLAVAYYGTDASLGDHTDVVSVLINRGDGSFASEFLCVAGRNARSIAIGDLDGDGFNDLVVGSSTFANASVHLNHVSPGRRAIRPSLK